MHAINVQFTCDECDLIKRDGVQLSAEGAKLCSKCIAKLVLHIAPDHVEMIKSMIASRPPRNANGVQDVKRR